MHALPPRKKRNSAKLNLILSTVFHGVIIGALFYLAAREGYLGKQLKTIAVQLVPKEKPPEKKPEEKKPEEPPKPKVVETPKPQPKVVEAPKVVTPPKVVQAPRLVPTAPPALAPPVAAPPPVSIGTFNFTDDSAKTVQSTSDPVLIYKGLVEYSLRSKWSRPAGLDDINFVAEVEVAIDATGKIAGTDWRKGSGDARWDDSVKRALSATTALSRPPPKNFPAKFVVRFDTQLESEPIGGLE